jgi:hypothetical protein
MEETNHVNILRFNVTVLSLYFDRKQRLGAGANPQEQNKVVRRLVTLDIFYMRGELFRYANH